MSIKSIRAKHAYSFDGINFYGFFDYIYAIFNIANMLGKDRVYIGIFDVHSCNYNNPFMDITWKDTIEKCQTIASNISYNHGPDNSEILRIHLKECIKEGFNKWMKRYAKSGNINQAISVKLYIIDNKTGTWELVPYLNEITNKPLENKNVYQ